MIVMRLNPFVVGEVNGQDACKYSGMNEKKGGN